MISESKSMWLIHIPGRAPFAMVGERIDYAEALRCARLIWPDAKVS